MKTRYLPVLVSVAFGATLMFAVGDETKPLVTAEAHPQRTQRNLEYFKDYLAKCPENEIRCLWFLRSEIHIGMVMTLDLNKFSVYTVRDVYDWALQNAENRELSDRQAYTASQLRSELPESAKSVEFRDGLHIAFWRDKSLHTVTYNKKAVPLEVQRLYDLGGGSTGFTFENPRSKAPKAEQAAPSDGDTPSN